VVEIVNKEHSGKLFHQCNGVMWSHGLRTSSEVANTLKSARHHVKNAGNPLENNSAILTYLDKLVPGAGDNDRVLGVGAEADARDPLGVALVGDGELAVTEGVPELDGAVARAGNDLSVVGGEGDRENVVGVANEAASGGASGELPETEGLVPRGGQSVSAVGGDDLQFPDLVSPSPSYLAMCPQFYSSSLYVENSQAKVA